MELQKTRDISYALKAIEEHFPAVSTPSLSSHRQADTQPAGYQQVRVDPLTNPVLLDYLRERGIPPEIARKTCKEIHFQNKGKWYFAVAFANRSGGYEIRNKYLKGSISPKEVTHIKNGSDRCMVFEGFIDYLSYLTDRNNHFKKNNTDGTEPDYMVLNSVGNVSRAIPLLNGYKGIFCFLDNDDAGWKAVREIQEAGKPVKDCSGCYKEYNDLNDYLLNKKMDGKNESHKLQAPHADKARQNPEHKTH